jgi:hypothetical protein
MKNFRFLYLLFVSFLAISFVTSCSSPKQVFYFQPGPATPKIAKPQLPAEPVFLASNALSLTSLPPGLPAEVADSENAVKQLEKNYSKKEIRQLVRTTLKVLKDSTNTRNKERRVGATVNKEQLAQLEAEAREVKNSVRVQNTDSKVTVDVKKPVTNLSQTELILVGVAGLLVLVLLLNLPVIGPILGIVLTLALVAAAVAILLGYIEINI